MADAIITQENQRLKNLIDERINHMTDLENTNIELRNKINEKDGIIRTQLDTIGENSQIVKDYDSLKWEITKLIGGDIKENPIEKLANFAAYKKLVVKNTLQFMNTIKVGDDKELIESAKKEIKKLNS